MKFLPQQLSFLLTVNIYKNQLLKLFKDHKYIKLSTVAINFTFSYAAFSASSSASLIPPPKDML